MRPADLIDETLEDYRAEIGELARSEEDLLSYALFPQTARVYLGAPSHRPRVRRLRRPRPVHQLAARRRPARAERRPRQGHPRHDRGERGGRGRHRRGRPQDHRAQGGGRAGGRGRSGSGRAAGSGRECGRRRERERLPPGEVEVGRHVLPLAVAAVAVVRRGGRRGRGRADALHPRDDEDDERADGRRRRRRPRRSSWRTARRCSTASRSSPSNPPEAGEQSIQRGAGRSQSQAGASRRGLPPVSDRGHRASPWPNW